VIGAHHNSRESRDDHAHRRLLAIITAHDQAGLLAALDPD